MADTDAGKSPTDNLQAAASSPQYLPLAIFGTSKGLTVAVIAITLLAAILTATFMGEIWRVYVLDTVALFVVFAASIITVAAAYANHRSDASARARIDNWLKIAGVFGTALAIFLTYGSFRNQVRLTSEGDLNQEAMALFEIEMAHAELRCVYDNYGGSDYEKCLQTLIKGEKGEWSLAMFYAEEAWFIIYRAKQDRKEWRSSYGDSLDYWVEDIEKDYTGIFSYQLVSTTDSMNELRTFLQDVDVRIPTICQKFLAVRAALVRAGKAAPLATHYCLQTVGR